MSTLKKKIVVKASNMIKKNPRTKIPGKPKLPGRMPGVRTQNTTVKSPVAKSKALRGQSGGR